MSDWNDRADEGRPPDPFGNLWAPQETPPPEAPTTPAFPVAATTPEVPVTRAYPIANPTPEAPTTPAFPVANPTPEVPVTRAYPLAPYDAAPPGHSSTVRFYAADPAYYYAPPPVPVPPQTHRLRNGLIIVGAMAVVAATTTFVVLDVVKPKQHASATAPTTSSSASASPSATSSPTPTTSLTSISTTQAFNTNLLNAAATDPIPFTSDALLPQEFVDGKGIAYKLESSGSERCSNAVMSSAVSTALEQFGCTHEMVGAYTVDSSSVDKTDDILVSVQVFAFKDSATAKSFAAEFPATDSNSWDFGIWCPTSGYGANPCSDSSDYADAARSETISQSYRYVLEATALYTELTTSHSEDAWTEAAAKRALQKAGPAAYLADQQ